MQSTTLPARTRADHMLAKGARGFNRPDKSNDPPAGQQQAYNPDDESSHTIQRR